MAKRELTEKQRAALDAGRAPPWGKGQSGNPSGRPKRKSLATLTREVLDERCPPKLLAQLAQDLGIPIEEVRGITIAEALVRRRALAAVSGKRDHELDQLLERAEPKARRVEHSVEGEVRHRAVRDSAAQLSEGEVAEIYLDTLAGGKVPQLETGEVVEAEVVED